MEKFINFIYPEKIKNLITGFDLGSLKLNLSNNQYELLILIIALIAAVFLINFFLVRSIFGQSYRIFAAPGVILHELSHALLCLLTGAKITRIALFDKEGGSVTHEKSKIPLIGQALISLAPFVFGVVAIYILANKLGVNSSRIDFTNPNFLDYGLRVKESILSINFSNYKNIIILYLICSVAITLMPSKDDFKNMIIPGVILSIILGAGFIFNLIPDFLLNLPIERLVVVLTTVSFLLILMTVLSMIIFAFSKLVKRS